MALTSDPPDIVQTTRFGYSAVVGDAEMMVWPVGSGYIYPTSPTEMHISSTISLDTDGDTGAHVIAVIGLDGNYVEQTEFVTMSGHLQNPTSTQFWRVFNLEVQSAGSNGKNVGMIFAATSGATDGLPNSELFARIESGDNSTHMPLYTIPASYQGELETWWGGHDEQLSWGGPIDLHSPGQWSTVSIVGPSKTSCERGPRS